jgi:hypothetical protein
MGAHSTLRITRTKAKEEMLKWLLADISDEKLGNFMDQILDDRLYNAILVPDDAPNDDEIV